ncbi:MAG: MFS transporter [Verrucomicrobiae bacterium]|nr:MFS transporter [Verrucomicrobiae bacterium]
MGPGAKAWAAQDRPRRSLRWAMLMQYATCGAVIPFVSMWLVDRGLSYHQISHIIMTSAGVLLVAPFFWGMVADRYVPLDRVLLLVNVLGAVALAVLAQQHEFGGLLAGYVAYTAFIFPTFHLINALGFHHLARPESSFSGLRAWGSVGWILPFVPISVWTASRPEAGLNFILYLGMALGLGMALLACYLPHTPCGGRRRLVGAGRQPAYVQAVRQLLGNPNYLVVLLSMFLLSGSFSLVTFYSPPFLEQLGMPRPWIGPAQAIGVVFEVWLFQHQPELIRRLNLVRTVVLGCLALVVRNLLFSVLSDLWLLALSYLLAGAFVVLYHIGASMLVNRLATDAVRASAQTMMGICSMGLGPMFANWMAGRLAAMSGNNLRPVFLFATFLAMLATLLIVGAHRSLRRVLQAEGAGLAEGVGPNNVLAGGQGVK